MARVAAAYVAPSGLLVHVIAAPYLYTVVATCPEALWCAPTEAVALPAGLMAAVGALLLVVWQVSRAGPAPGSRLLCASGSGPSQASRRAAQRRTALRRPGGRALRRGGAA